MVKTIKIGERLVGGGQPCYIIAEAGVNHNGNIGIAKKMVEVAHEAGADAIKFQTFKAESIASEGAEKAAYQKESTGNGSQFEMLKKLELSEAEFAELERHARTTGIAFLSTPFDEDNVDILEKIGVPAYKIPSGEITNFPLLKYIAKKRKPVIMSTGMATMEEILEAVECLRSEGAEQIALMQCTSEYPAPLETLNLKVIQTLEQETGLLVGFSDHSPGIIAPIVAVALGACIMEKHFTLDKTMEGPDHKASLEPDELRKMVDSIRDAEKTLGTGEKTLTLMEIENRKVVRKSIVAARDIEPGTLLKQNDFTLMRPGCGIPPCKITDLIGRVTNKEFKRGELISWEGLD